MKFLRLVLAMVLLSAIPAVYADNVKIGWINIERIFREAAPAQKATKKLEKEFAARDADLQRLGKQARDLQTSLDRDGMTMSESDRNAKQRELADLNREFQRKQREFREDLNTRRNEELAGIQERANQVIRQIAVSEKYDLIISDVIYASPTIDITDKVLKSLADKQ
ncbi:OmpH family outer membrane protein [Ferrovum sp. PN-J185]|jgi:outer membrane protein|uniref:OmpH family outer membrane protein n=1 Tax=Ferrovum sp. PN-J185 TaxID=1356306 RepID=UPI00079BD092|nr:OmpH family outer membrane protein [Ferrovum sp. PN-J185]KXW56312.1 chaperone protein Skp precursor [Ferrovum sp. PN-J185]MCC6069036.1 OmpH family outer membrane protein [Ferrovum sp. PN-J185]MDE1890984.1 OmpH family outer membrane protein [Betaproteobacteria bacterium]MDE2055704.1 OmpH family outer membrane protein [Betaproteobacteria bacterium]